MATSLTLSGILSIILSAIGISKTMQKLAFRTAERISAVLAEYGVVESCVNMRELENQGRDA